MSEKKKPSIRFKGFTEAWEQRKLGEVFEEYSEKNHEELPPLMIVQGGGTLRRDESDRNLMYDKANLLNYKMVKEGDFIVHLRSFEGGLEMATNTGIISPAYHTLHGENTDSRFYYSYFRSKKFIDTDLKPHVYGIRDGRSIDIDGMKTINIPYTSFSEQKAIGDCISAIDHLITLHQRKYDKLINIKKSMLEKMFPHDGEIVPEIRFAGFTEAWEQRKFDELFDCTIPNNTLSRAELNYESGDVRNIHYGDILIKYGSVVDIQNDEIPFATGKSSDDFKSALLQDGDIIIADTAEDETTGKACEIGNLQGLDVVSGLHTMVCRPRNKMALGYLGYYLNSDAYHRQLLPLMQGIKVLSLSRTNVQKTMVCYPKSTTEQQLIADCFSNLDYLITLHQCKCSILERLKRIFFAVIDKTVWEQRKLGDVVKEVTRNDPASEAPIMMITANNGFIEQSERYAFNNAGESLKKYILLEKGELAYNHGASKLRPYGSCFALITAENARIPFVYHCFSTENQNAEFMSIELNGSEIENQLRKIVSSGARMDGLLNISFDEYTSVSILLPDVEEQDRIANFFRNLDRLITLHQRKLKLLQQMKKAMQQALFVEKNISKTGKELQKMTFRYEADFEEALIKVLSNKGWEKDVIKYPTEKDLLDNWAKILFDNNRGIDRLNNYPLTEGEMQQILEQINALRTPIKLNTFINGKTVSIKRDNPDDKEHFGKEVSLKIYDRREIAAGQSRYQIVQQPVFPRKSKILNDRRGDLMLLINGMPVIHIELKRSGVPVSYAYNQIEKYSHEGIFTGLFSLVQVFVAMAPDETRYYANPGLDGQFNSDYYFQWADFNNEPINDWKDIASSLLSIPMAHQLIGFYTVADESDGILKVMRSYQYYAANAISDKVAKTKWDEKNQRGGFIWHTTGSGKTMTSFKSAQLIADSQDADKVVFLMDRIELGTQSLGEYRGFAGESKGISNEQSSVKATENTYTLISKLKSDSHLDTLIVTSIQKMSRIKDEDGGLNAYDIEKINGKRIVFIVDEAHRSTFGDMLLTIKNTFPNAIFFGFTGTPIQEENQKKMNTTTTVFGNELHRYSIADGIRDKNVLGFDPYKVMTYKDTDVRRVVALEKAKAKIVEEALADPKKSEIYYKYMDSAKIKMAGYMGKDGKYVKGIEDFIPNSQYRTAEHQKKVVEDIADKWLDLSHASKFHAIFATSSIPEAIEYYRLLKEKMSSLKITCLFDPNIDNGGGVQFKEEGLIEIIDDYNKMYDDHQAFSIGTHAGFKKDIALRLAHKEYYKGIEREPDKQLDLLIVVDQMLTGFDSKWVNTLYMDKVLEFENIIQAFSRTNRLFGTEKPFGTIRYYRRPHTMERNINEAVRLYSGNKPIALFVDKLYKNLKKMNELFDDIKELYKNAGIRDFSKLPEEKSVVAKFTSLFNEFNNYLEAAKIQGFKWIKTSYEFIDEEGNEAEITVGFDETTYLILVQRYKEIPAGDPVVPGGEDIPYELAGYIIEIDTGRIDADYMNSRFEKYLKALRSDEASEERKEQALNELHKSFATLNQEEQKYANIFLHDVQGGDVFVEEGKTLRDYITEYQFKAKNDQIHRFAERIGIYEEKLRNMMDLKLTESNINEFGRLDELKSTIDKSKAKAYFESKEGIKLNPPKVNIRIDVRVRLKQPA